MNRKLLRDLRSHKAQFASVLAIVALGTVILATLLIVPRSLDARLARIFEATDYEDARFQVADAPQAAAGRLEALENVSAVEATREEECPALVDGTEMNVRVISLPGEGNPAVNSLMIESGAYPPGDDEPACVVERHMAEEFGLRPGQEVTLLVGGREVPLKVSGTGASPRYLRLVANQSSLIEDPAQFGVIFMRAGEMDRVFGGARTNMFALRVRDVTALDATVEEASRLLAPYGVVSVNTGGGEQSTRLIRMDLDNMRNISVFFTLVFLWVASLAIYIALARVIYTEQRQIGTARALGYEKRSIATHFLLYGVLIGVAGGVVGAAGGIFTARLLEHSYSAMLGLPAVQRPPLPWGVLGVAVAAAVALCVLGAVMPALKSARIAPAAAMRIDAGVSLHAPPDQKRRPGLKRPGPWLRFPLRNLSRNRRRTVLTALGLVLTVSTLVTVSGVLTSMDFMIRKQLDSISTWDVAALLDGPHGPELLEAVASLPGVERAEGAIESPARIRTPGGSADVLVQAYRSDTAMHGLKGADGAVEPPGPGGLLVNRSITKDVPLKVGGTVTVDTAVGSMRMKVEGLLAEPMGVGCYADLSYVQEFAGTRGFNAVFVRAAPGEADGVAGTMRHMPGVVRVQTRSRLFQAMDEIISKMFRPIFLVFLVMILCIGFAIILTMVSITILERRPEIATMRTLGWGPGAVARSFLVEVEAVGLAVVPVGLALGWALCWVLINKVLSTGTAQLAPEMNITPAVYVGVACAFLATMALSVVPSIRGISRMDLASAARERGG